MKRFGYGFDVGLRLVLLALFVSLVLVQTTFAVQPLETAQDEFVPMDEIPAEEQLPAAPLLVTAYAAVWAIAIGYLWTIGRRLGALEREIMDISRRVADREGS